MNWIKIKSESELQEALNASHEEKILIFKHSTRCGISRMVLKQFERAFVNEMDMPCYYLDLIAYRSVSNAISTILGVIHESPQAILVEKGEALLHASHHSIVGSFIEEIKGSSLTSL